MTTHFSRPCVPLKRLIFSPNPVGLLPNSWDTNYPGAEIFGSKSAQKGNIKFGSPTKVQTLDLGPSGPDLGPDLDLNLSLAVCWKSCKFIIQYVICAPLSSSSDYCPHLAWTFFSFLTWFCSCFWRQSAELPSWDTIKNWKSLAVILFLFRVREGDFPSSLREAFINKHCEGSCELLCLNLIVMLTSCWWIAKFVQTFV